MKNLNEFFPAISFLLALNLTGYSQISNKINPDWTNNSDWNGGNAPQYNTISSATLNHNSAISSSLIINAGHTISVNNGKTLSTSQSITIKDGGQLLIVGTLDGTQSGMDLIIEQGGSLIMQAGSSVDWDGNVFISGDLSITTINGALKVGGNFEVDNGALIDGNGTITVFGTTENRGTIFGCINPFDQCCGGTPCVLSASILPVELIDFNANINGNPIVLNWVTATEINNDYFDVERSSDKESYAPIIRVDGGGNSTTALYYKTEDKSPILYKTSYYRLRQTDFDGIFSFSDPVFVNYRENNPPEIFFYLYPGSGEKRNIMVSGNENEYGLEIFLYDFFGKKVYSQFVTVKNGQILILNFSEKLANGMYVMIINCGELVFHQRVVIAK